MIPEDIIVGAKYRNTKFPNTVYLGIGFPDGFGNIVSKGMVIVNSWDEPDYVGRVCVSKSDCEFPLWDTFVPIKPVSIDEL